MPVVPQQPAALIKEGFDAHGAPVNAHASQWCCCPMSHAPHFRCESWRPVTTAPIQPPLLPNALHPSPIAPHFCRRFLERPPVAPLRLPLRRIRPQFTLIDANGHEHIAMKKEPMHIFVLYIINISSRLSIGHSQMSRQLQFAASCNTHRTPY